MSHFKYRIVTEWSDEDRAFVARVPALPGCSAHGPTAARATGEAQKAAEAILEVMGEHGRPLPPEDVSADFSGQLRLRMPRSLHEQLARLSSAEGVSLNQLLVALLAQGAGQGGRQKKPRRGRKASLG